MNYWKITIKCLPVIYLEITELTDLKRQVTTICKAYRDVAFRCMALNIDPRIETADYFHTPLQKTAIEDLIKIRNEHRRLITLYSLTVRRVPDKYLPGVRLNGRFSPPGTGMSVVSICGILLLMLASAIGAAHLSV
jgi:hypothetical protein